MNRGEFLQRLAMVAGGISMESFGMGLGKDQRGSLLTGMREKRHVKN